jgi:hypothetical protein
VLCEGRRNAAAAPQDDGVRNAAQDRGVQGGMTEKTLKETKDEVKELKDKIKKLKKAKARWSLF